MAEDLPSARVSLKTAIQNLITQSRKQKELAPSITETHFLLALEEDDVCGMADYSGRLSPTVDQILSLLVRSRKYLPQLMEYIYARCVQGVRIKYPDHCLFQVHIRPRAEDGRASSLLACLVAGTTAMYNSQKSTIFPRVVTCFEDFMACRVGSHCHHCVHDHVHGIPPLGTRQGCMPRAPPSKK